MIGYLIILSAALGMQLSLIAEPANNNLLDYQFRLLRRVAPDPLSNDVVIIGFDEKTYSELPEPVALWHPYLGRLMRGLAEAKPAVVGLDITLPIRSYNFLIPQYDISLLQGIHALKQVAPLVLGQSLDEKRRHRPIFPPYVAVAGGLNAVASDSVCQDEDDVVRRFAEKMCNGTKITTLAGRMAEHLGIKNNWDGLIDYGVGAPLNYIPMIDVLGWIERGDQERLRTAFSGKAVLLGAILLFEDRRRLPVALAAREPEIFLLPGVMIHAQALRSMLKNGMIQPLSAPLLSLLVALAALFWWHPGNRWKLLLFMLSFPLIYATTTLALRHGLYIPAATLMICATLSFFSRSGVEGLRNYLEKKQLRTAFSGYVSPLVLKEILSGKIKPGLGGERVHAAVLFSDIRNFTTRSESLTPERTIDLLNSYFSEMTEAVQNNDGMIDKFIGDGIMASFGALQALPNASLCALKAAQEMLERLERLNLELVKQGHTPVAIGIGIHTGEVIAGNVGSLSRHEYTLIGDTVNIASRLESATKELGYPIVCSAQVADAVGHTEGLHDLGEQPIKGHSKIHVYGWLPPSLPNSTDATPRRMS